MPIVHEYRVPRRLQAEAAYAGAGAVAGEDQRRYLEQQAESARRFNEQQSLAGLEADRRYRLQQDQLALQDLQFNQRYSLEALQTGLQNQLQWAGVGLQQQNLDQDWAALGQQAIGQQLQADAENVRANAAIEQQRMKLAAAAQQKVEEQKMQRAIRAQEQIHKHPFTSQAQYDAAVQQWEQLYGMDWDFPQRAIAQQQMEQGETRREMFIQAHASAFGLDPETVAGLTIEGEGGIPQLLVPPQTLAQIAKTRMDNERLTAKDAQDFEAKTKESEAKIAADRHKYEMDVQKSRAAAKARYYQLLQEAARAASTKGDAATGKPAKTVTPDQLPREVRERLSRQALQENPPPIKPPGL